MKTVVKVHGKNATFEIVEIKGTWSTTYKLYRDGKYKDFFNSKADAVRKAHELAGSGAYES